MLLESGKPYAPQVGDANVLSHRMNTASSRRTADESKSANQSVANNVSSPVAQCLTGVSRRFSFHGSFVWTRALLLVGRFVLDP